MTIIDCIYKMSLLVAMWFSEVYPGALNITCRLSTGHKIYS